MSAGLTTIPGALVRPVLDEAISRITDVGSEIEALAAEIDVLLARRATLLEDTARKLDEIGCEVLIEDMGRARYPRGAIVWVEEQHGSARGPNRGTIDRTLRVSGRWRGRDADPRIYLRASYWPDGGHDLRIPRGRWRCLMNDEGKHLWARISADDIGHHESISMLRNWARKSDLRVRARGDHMQLIDPLGYVAHEGTIASAFRWLCGYENTPEAVAA